MTTTAALLARVHREEWARVVAAVARRFADLDIAEEAAAEAFLTAVERWPDDGVPPNPGAWLTTTAHRKAIDRIRREAKYAEASRLTAPAAPLRAVEDGRAIEDDRLRLIVTCCHPGLPMPARVALTLRMVGGLTVPQIAHAFMVSETAMSRRITRAKSTIRAAGIPWDEPLEADLAPRIAGVLSVIYLIFNEGYLSSGPAGGPVRTDLATEAIHLGRVIHALRPGEDETAGLLALMLLIHARRDARVSADGALVPLDAQDRGRWDKELIAEGHALVRTCLDSGRPPGRYQILAAINAVHTDAATFADTDWSQVLALYDQLAHLDPSPVVRLNRAVAVAELHGPAAALALVDPLPLGDYHAYHATRADLLRRQGRWHQARAAYADALRVATNPAEVAFLTSRRDSLPGPPA